MLVQTSGRLAGLDVGDKRIGVAVSDGLDLTAQPLAVINRRAAAADVAAIMDSLKDYEVRGFVVGLPLLPSGDEGEQASRVRNFCQTLEDGSSLPIFFQDERLTSRQSERLLIDAGMKRKKRRGVIDKVAAVLILQSYLDFHQPTPEPGL